jgi:hypothetical protein
MKHRICTAAALMSLLLTAGIPSMVAAADSADTFDYTLLSDGSISVSCLDTTITEVEVPSEIDGYAVTALADGCFEECTELTSVTLPEGITSIGEGAFYDCSVLTEITLPESVTEIGAYAFFGCSTLTEFRIPAAVTEIGTYAFDTTEDMTAFSVASENTSFTDIDGVLFDKEGTLLIKYPESKADSSYTVPDSCSAIADWGFVGSQYLEELDLGQVTEIGADAFYYCISLRSITIPEGVTALTGAAFGYCISLESVEVPSTVTEIGDDCFYSCTSLSSVSLSEGLTKIGTYAFFHCTSMDSLQVPDSVENISAYSMGYYYDSDAEDTAVQDGFTLYVTKDSPAYTYASSNAVPYEFYTPKSSSNTIYYALLGVLCAVIAGLGIAIGVVVKKRKEASV